MPKTPKRYFAPKYIVKFRLEKELGHVNLENLLDYRQRKKNHFYERS